MRKQIEDIVQSIYQDGWAVVDGFIEEDFRKELLEEQQDILAHGQFRHAGIGKGENFSVRPEIRGDKVFWMEEGGLSPAQEKYRGMVEQLRKALNRRCFLGLKSFESHFAMYPPGSFYVRHLDQFQQVKYRIVTIILYLNEDWSTEDGGALRIFLPESEKYEDIYPVGGRLVAFLSAEIPHEVQVTYKERISITGWLRDIEQ